MTAKKKTTKDEKPAAYGVVVTDPWDLRGVEVEPVDADRYGDYVFRGHRAIKGAYREGLTLCDISQVWLIFIDRNEERANAFLEGVRAQRRASLATVSPIVEAIVRHREGEHE